MLQTTDQGHFFKYLTTLGVAVVAATLTGGGLLLNVQSDLLIENSRIVKLSPVAQEVIAKKQGAILMVANWAPLVILLFLIVGLVLIIVGLVGWKRRQDTLDARDEAELNKILVEVQQMTDQERNDKVQAEAREIAESDIAAQLDRESSATDTGSPGAGVVIPSIARIADTVREQEAYLIEKLSQAFPHDEVQSGVAIHSTSSAMYVDALVVQKKRRRLYVVELKVYGDAVRIKNITSAVHQVTAMATMLESRYSNFAAVPVLVVIADSLGMARRERLRETVALQAQALRSQPLLLIYSPAEFKDLTSTALFRDVTSAGLRLKSAAAE